MTGTSGRRRAARAPDPRRARRRAELWRAAGLGFSLVWAVVLGLVVAFWARVTFSDGSAEDLPGSLDLLLTAVAFVCAGLAVWTVVDALWLFRRRTSGWDAVIVLGSFSVAVSLLVGLPRRFLHELGSAPGPIVWGLGVLGLASVVTGLLAQRAFRRAAEARERSAGGDAVADAEDDGLG